MIYFNILIFNDIFIYLLIEIYNNFNFNLKISLTLIYIFQIFFKLNYF